MKTIPEEELELLTSILKELKKLNKINEIEESKMSKDDIEYTRNLERSLKARRNKPVIL